MKKVFFPSPLFLRGLLHGFLQTWCAGPPTCPVHLLLWLTRPGGGGCLVGEDCTRGSGGKCIAHTPSGLKGSGGEFLKVTTDRR